MVYETAAWGKFEDYMARKGLAGGTCRHYRWVLERFFDHAEVDPDEIIEKIATISDRNRIFYLKAVFGLLHDSAGTVACGTAQNHSYMLRTFIRANEL